MFLCCIHWGACSEFQKGGLGRQLESFGLTSIDERDDVEYIQLKGRTLFSCLMGLSLF